jgi:hypothetical protein
MCLAVVFLSLAGPARLEALEGTSARQTPFALVIQDDLVSLDAKEASLKAIFEEIGRRMNISVRAEIPATAKVTLALVRLPLPEVLKRLGRYVNYGYVEQREQGVARISAITIHSLKGQSFPTERGAEISRQAPAAKALELEIDPSQFLKQNPQ